jgi:hypothetical protein
LLFSCWHSVRSLEPLLLSFLLLTFSLISLRLSNLTFRWSFVTSITYFSLADILSRRLVRFGSSVVYISLFNTLSRLPVWSCLTLSLTFLCLSLH